MRMSRPQSVAEQKQEDRTWRERFVQNDVTNVELQKIRRRVVHLRHTKFFACANYTQHKR